MLYVETPRLILVATPLGVMRQRLQQDEFEATIPLPSPLQPLQVRFPPEWPGDALEIFPFWIEQIEKHPDDLNWNGIMVDRVERVAVGGMGFKGPPDSTGTVELGYGVNASRQSRGYATEMARAAVRWVLQQPNVLHAIAECLENNAASIRVLEKSGFVRVGHKQDSEGPLILWKWSH